MGWQGLLRLDAKALGISPSDPRFDKHFAIDVRALRGLQPPPSLSVCVVRPLDPLPLPPTHSLTLTLTHLPRNGVVSRPDCLGSVAPQIVRTCPTLHHPNPRPLTSPRRIPTDARWAIRGSKLQGYRCRRAGSGPSGAALAHSTSERYTRTSANSTVTRDDVAAAARAGIACVCASASLRARRVPDSWSGDSSRC